jgi:hypothetical protein
MVYGGGGAGTGEADRLGRSGLSSICFAEATTRNSEREDRDEEGKAVSCVGSTGDTRRSHAAEERERQSSGGRQVFSLL